MPPAAPRVLLVDDDPSVQNSVRRSLLAHGYVVQIAKNGSSAIKKLRASPPDLVLLAITMPDVTGFDVLAWMRQNGCAAPVILLTAKNSSEPIADGVGAVLSKPFDDDELLAAVRTVLGT